MWYSALSRKRCGILFSQTRRTLAHDHTRPSSCCWVYPKSQKIVMGQDPVHSLNLLFNTTFMANYSAVCNHGFQQIPKTGWCNETSTNVHAVVAKGRKKMFKKFKSWGYKGIPRARERLKRVVCPIHWYITPHCLDHGGGGAPQAVWKPPPIGSRNSLSDN